MKKFIVPIFCYLCILIVLLNLNKITSFLANILTNNPNPKEQISNEYTKTYGFLYIQDTNNYTPYSYTDLLRIIYSTINHGNKKFTFYCPEEYTDCIKDMSNITKDELNLSHINNFVHPYNSFNTIQTSITESGEITIDITYLYKEEEIEKINEFVNEKWQSLYNEQDSDYDNIKRIHDYIINNTKYDIERNDKNDSKYKSFIAYGPAIEGYATCNGYADLMAIFLSKMNIENYKIATNKGEISYESNGHVWNALKIDKTWLHLDLTWDDPVSSDGKDYLYHKYFLVTTEEMQEADSGDVTIEEHKFNASIYQEFKD